MSGRWPHAEPTPPNLVGWGFSCRVGRVFEAHRGPRLSLVRLEDSAHPTTTTNCRINRVRSDRSCADSRGGPRGAGAAHPGIGSKGTLKDKTWNHPAAARGRLFVRNGRELVCFRMAGR